jgi:Bacterial dipeptidyl-peptidase Sh3 domain
MQQLSAPIFAFGGSHQLSADDSHVRNGFAGVSFVLSGPGVKAEAGRLPVRGDLAHIKLAGRYFVPHYVVPMPRNVACAAVVLRKSASDEAEGLETLAGGTVFNVLDMAGSWAWGQVGEDGFVGYLPLAALEPSP